MQSIQNAFIGYKGKPFACYAEMQSVQNNTKGFSESYATPIQNGGNYFRRRDANLLGFLSTIYSFVEQSGFPNEYNTSITYQKNSIIDYVDSFHDVKKIKAKKNNPQSPSSTLNDWDNVTSKVSANENYFYNAIVEMMPLKYVYHHWADDFGW